MRHTAIALASFPCFAACLAFAACTDDKVAESASTGTDAGPGVDSGLNPPRPDDDGGVCGAGAFAWGTAGGGAGQYDAVRGVAVAPDGSTWLTGTFIGAAKWGEIALSAVDKVHTTAFVAKLDSSGKVLFAKTIGGDAANTTHVGERVRVDASGNAYVVGTFTTKVTIDGITIEQHNLAGAGAAFVMKLDPTGKAVWAEATAGNGLDEFGHDVFVDDAGDVYMTGSYNGQAKFVTQADDGGVLELLTTPAEGGGEKLFVAKYSQATHRWIWAKGFIGHASGGSAGGEGLGITGHADGTVTVTGAIHDELDLDGTLLRANEGSFLAKLAKDDGHVVWATAITNAEASPSVVNAIASDNLGNVFLTGRFKGTAVFESVGAPKDAGVDEATTLAATGTGQDMFIAKYDANGLATWFHRAGVGSSSASGHDVAFDGTDSVYVTGKKQGDAAFDGQILSKSGDFFVARYDTAGTIQWVSGSKNAGHTGGAGLAVAAPAGAALVAVGGAFDLETTLGTVQIVSAGNDDGFVTLLCK